MRYLIAIVLMVVFAADTYSQTFEVGPFVGGANYIGDVGRTNYIYPNTLVAGGLVKWNQSPRHSFRLSVLYANIQANDKKSDDPRRVQRGYSFNNTIFEGSLGIEYTFWHFDLHEGAPQSAPYLYTGLTYFMADHLQLKNGPTGNLVNEGTNWEFAIPMVFGYKETITNFMVAGMEIGARYTFTDNLDGSWPEELLGDRAPDKEFGNTNTKDWYVFTGVYLTFNFGRKPCFSHF
ncbi:type IX secretion system protein PorG [Salegentibacter chungangensis]|uniref:DUF6089 family protein n=1 Tax=Salegentibacter chungangensis TaxID=1335724 RepID=A0ABW3NN37_9FLAO